MDKDSLKNVLVKEPKLLAQKSALQSSLSDLYGSAGARIFFVIDGRKTGEEVIKESGVEEDKALEILNFIEKQGFISMEKPLEAEPGKKPEVQKIELAPPLTEETPHPERLPKTPMEKKLYDKFGSTGLAVYHLVDEIKRPEDILKETKLSEEQLIKILQFMVQEGVVKLGKEEKPAPPQQIPQAVQTPAPQAVQSSAPVAVEKPVVAEQKPAAKVEPPQRAPILELHAPAIVSAPKTYENNTFYMPMKRNMKFLDKLTVRAALIRRFGNDGLRVLSMVDNKRTAVRIVKDSKIDMDRVDSILAFLSDREAVTLSPLSVDEIREKYGDEGVSIFNKYGGDGILLYELIDKRANIRDIVRISKIPPKSAIEIFAYIHKILGLDIPLDMQLLQKQLGMSE